MNNNQLPVHKKFENSSSKYGPCKAKLTLRLSPNVPLKIISIDRKYKILIGKSTECTKSHIVKIHLSTHLFECAGSAQFSIYHMSIIIMA